MFTGPDKMFDFVKYPWIPDGRSSDHNSVNAKPVFVFFCLLGRVDVTIAKNRDPDPWIVFNPCDQGPVGIAFVEL